MKLRTKLAIVVLAAILSLAGFGAIASALSVDHIMAAARPEMQITVEITG